MREKIIEFLKLNFLNVEHVFDMWTARLRELYAPDITDENDDRVKALAEVREVLRSKEPEAIDEAVEALSGTFSEEEMDALLAYFKSDACTKWGDARALFMARMSQWMNTAFEQRKDLQDRILIQPSTEWLKHQPGTGQVIHRDELEELRKADELPSNVLDETVKDAPSTEYVP